MTMDPTTSPEVALDRFSTVADGLDHPECVAVGPDGQLYASGEAGQVYRLDPDGPTIVANTGGFVLGLCLDADSVIYACDQFRHEVVRIGKDGTVESYSERIQTPNYPVFTADGTLFVSDSGTWDGNDGFLYRIGVGGDCRRLDVDVPAFPNGLALSPGGDWLYVVLSQLPGVVRIPIVNAEPAGPPEVVLTMPGHVPDGLATLANGDLLVACYSPDTIYRVHNGQASVLAHDPRRVVLASPTNLALYGPGRTRMAVGSLGRWHVASADIGLAGAALEYPSMPR
jgi:sugar lactone lactonase YvrE